MQLNSENPLNIYNFFYQSELRAGINNRYHKLQFYKIELFKLLEEVGLIVSTREKKGDIYKKIVMCCINGMRISQPLIDCEKSIENAYKRIINHYDKSGTDDFIVFSRYFYIYSVKIVDGKYFEIFLELLDYDSKILMPFICEDKISQVNCFMSTIRISIVDYYNHNKTEFDKDILIQGYLLQEINSILTFDELMQLINQSEDINIAALSLYRWLHCRIGWRLQSGNPVISKFSKLYQLLDKLSQQGSCIATISLIHFVEYLIDRAEFHSLAISQHQIILLHKRAILQGYIRGFEKIKDHTLFLYVKGHNLDYLTIAKKIIPGHDGVDRHIIPENLQGDFQSYYSNTDPESTKQSGMFTSDQNSDIENINRTLQEPQSKKRSAQKTTEGEKYLIKTHKPDQDDTDEDSSSYCQSSYQK